MRHWLWSKIKRQIPRIIDSTQVNHSVIGQKTPWYFSERRFLVFGKKGPWELVIKPSHVGACAMVFSGFIFTLGYFSVQTLNSAFSVANQELISPADASLMSLHNASAEIEKLEDAILSLQKMQDRKKAGPWNSEQLVTNDLFSMNLRDIRNSSKFYEQPFAARPTIQQPESKNTGAVELTQKLYETIQLREDMLSSLEEIELNSSQQEMKQEIQIVFDLPKFENGFALLPQAVESPDTIIENPNKNKIVNEDIHIYKFHREHEVTLGVELKELPNREVASIKDGISGKSISGKNISGDIEKNIAGQMQDDETQTITAQINKLPAAVPKLNAVPSDMPLLMNDTVRDVRFIKSIERELRVIETVFADLGINLNISEKAELRDVNLEWPVQPGSENYLEYMRQQFVKLDIYRDALASLPLHSPMKYYYISSNYGKRKHPVTKKWAMHYGIDLAGTWQEEVRATAEGTVVFAGWEGSFGRVVRIEHQFGIQTVYAHLARLDVKKGEYVTLGDIVGSMGSSGRSAGVHLHYEIRINQQPKNPKNFFDVGQSLLSPNSIRFSAYQ